MDLRKFLYKLSYLIFLLTFLSKYQPSNASNELVIGTSACKVCNCTLSPLVHVDCRARNLTANSIPKDLPLNTSQLDLSNNKIENLDALQELTELQVLRLVGNRLSQWREKWLKASKKLKYLSLSQNKLTQPPSVCNGSPNLTSLLLDANKLKNAEFSADYMSCNALRKIVLSLNSYTNITAKIFYNLAKSPVKSLTMSRVQLKNASSDSLASFALLESLDLGRNPELSEPTLASLLNGANLTMLKSLQLKNSSLKQLPELNAKRLEQISLSESREFYELQANATKLMPNLRVLSLQNTNISSWSADSMQNLKKLTHIDLRGTPITTIGGIDGNVNPLPQLTDKSFKEIRISGAQLTCDCSLLWLINQLKLRVEVFKDINSTHCYMPVDKRNLPLLEFKPQNCENSSTSTSELPTTTANPHGPDNSYSKLQLILIIGGLSLATIFFSSIATIIVCRKCRKPEAPRFVLDDDSDPLVSPGQHTSIWIRLRTLLSRRSSQQQQSRPPIFQSAPEDYLSEDA